MGSERETALNLKQKEINTMETNTRPIEISENKLLFHMLSDIDNHIMPLILKARMAYIEDSIAFDQLSHLSREFAKVTNLISVIYNYRLYNGDRSKIEDLISNNTNLHILKNDWLSIWSILSLKTQFEIAELNIVAINKLSELRQETYNKCNCFQ